MARTCERVMEERMRAALILVRARCRADGPLPGGGTTWAALSYAELASVLGMTREQARCVLRRLTGAGLLVMRTRHLPNGGQVENSYLLTDEGRAFLG